MRFLVVCIVVAAMSSVVAAKDKFQVTEFVKQQLNSIGTEQARTAVKNRAAKGTVKFSILTKPEVWDGSEILLSEGDKLAFLLQFPPAVYRDEWYVRDGNKTSVIPDRPTRWSRLSQFVMVHNEILTEGLWGGTLSTGWALINLDERRARLEDRGIKSVNGRELHRIDYFPKKSSDLSIQLYFEPDTFRHVMTAYVIDNRPMPVYRLEEHFGDFKSVDNLSLPGKWTIEFTSNEWLVERYEVTEENISHNVSLDPKNFKIK
jgi:hypothetical protein